MESELYREQFEANEFMIYDGNEDELNEEEMYKSFFETNIKSCNNGDCCIKNEDYSVTISNEKDTKMESNSTIQDTKNENEKIFDVSKDYFKKMQKLKKKINKKDLMKIKIDNTKKLLNTKRQNESNVLPLENTHIDTKPIDKKEIKKIRNRISAQKSRDKQKFELMSLKKENIELKSQIDMLLSLIQSCDSCNAKYHSTFSIEDNTSISTSTPVSPFCSTTTKAISLTGILAVICIINIFFFGNLSTSDNQSVRYLQEIENLPEADPFNNSLASEIMQYPSASLPALSFNDDIIPIVKKPYPILQTFKENLRQNFLFSLITRIHNSQKKNALLRRDYYEFEHCPNFDSVNYQMNSFDDEYNKYTIMPVDINKNYLDYLSRKVESIYCNDYISTNLTNHNNINFEALLNREKGEDCLYLHLVFPFEGEDSANVIIRGNASDTQQKEHIKKKGYYEIGCKVFDIKKVTN